MSQRRAVVVWFAILLGIWPLMTAGQEATPGTLSQHPLDLAAMALAADDVPEGFFDDYGEWVIPADVFAELVLGGAATPPGLERVYQSFYFNPDEVAGIHAFLFEFASPTDAASGLEISEDVLRPPLPPGTVVGPTYTPGGALGDDSSVMTTVAYDSRAEGGPLVDVVATAFRRDRLVAGVAVESFTDPPEPGIPIADLGTPSAPDSAQEQLAVDLATRLDTRVMAVLDGDAPEGVDLALPDLVLPIDQLVDGPVPVLGGYKAGIDLLRCGVCGEENALLPFADVALGGYARTVSIGPLVEGEPQPPFVSVAVSDFVSLEAALDVLAAIREAPNDRPTPGPIPRGTRTPTADPVIPGASAALAFYAVPETEDPTASPDSAGVDFVVGNRLVTIDVLGGVSSEEALAAATDLATQQAACLTAGGPCASVSLPAALANATLATPVS